MPYPRILVITSCTGEKRSKPEAQLTLADFQKPDQLQQREAELAEFACAAGQLYTGMQHLRVMEGVHVLRDVLGDEAIQVQILSAGYGLIPESQTIVPYEVTFNGMKGHEVDEWATHLNVHEQFEDAIANYDLVFVLLGDNYLRAVKLPIQTSPEQTLVFLASKGSAKKIKGLAAETFVLPLSNAEAKLYRYGLVGLKGFLFKQFAQAAAVDPELLLKVRQTPNTFQEIIAPKVTEEDQQLVLTNVLKQVPTTKATPKQSKRSTSKAKKKPDFLPIPDVPAAANVGLGMEYFIPEWDDHVDPGYDFIKSKVTPNRDPYADEVYAHQIYETPNYDGILVSKVVVDGSKKKRARIEDIGIHEFIRFPGKVMGDCGAFGYVKEEVPPYDTEEILDYYENLGFDYGVSIDHLIVGPFAKPGIREQRYELTMNNAREFLEKHQAGGYGFIPIGVAQGWSSETYAESVKENIRVGYDYIALGGLARAQSREIIEILKEVRPHLKQDTRLHLFGVARIDAIPVFRHLGITSFDSASPLRRAWLGSGANYHTDTKKMYTAVRIPPVDGHGVRVKRLVEAGVADKDTFRDLEQSALKALRAYDKNKLSLEETLEKLLAYDELLELPQDGQVDVTEQAKRRAKHEVMYGELLSERPWQRCNCVICNEIGVEVVIFRGNDRNRRRGFHNTFVFYQRFKDVLHRCEHGLPLASSAV
ncbi:MAG: tRNA-guanine transglycosylase DpdA [Leptolyngbyaceae cyanobacterium]